MLTNEEAGMPLTW